MVSCQFDSGLQPVFCFSSGAVNVYMHACFFSREKEKPESSFPKYRRAHNRNLRAYAGNFPGTSFCVDFDGWSRHAIV